MPYSDLRVLGISAFYHDSAAALVTGGRVIAAAQEERFTRRKHDLRFPGHAIAYCLAEAGCRLRDVDLVVFYEKPFLKFERLLETYLSYAPRGFDSFRLALPLWLKEKLFQKEVLRKALRKYDADFDGTAKLRFSEHHLSHAASAFYPSPFEEAAVLTLDGVGEWATASLAIGLGKSLDIVKEMHFPHSLGLLYSAFTYYTGFRVNSGEYKLMGLAPYGEPRYVDKILNELIDLKEDGTFRIDQSYFGYCTGLTMTNGRFAALFGQPVRRPEDPLGRFHMDIAASIQAVTEEIMLRLAGSVARETGLRKLCLAGGVALNCVANGKILRAGIFDDMWVQPAAGDAGGALGAALFAYYQEGGALQKPINGGDAMQGAYLGPAYTAADAGSRLQECGAHYTTLAAEDLIEAAAQALAAGKAVGWFQGRMEFGPRALGARSILADPRSPTMQKILNLKIKYRESFRPFAPAILREDLADWFDCDVNSPYMLLVAQVQPSHRRTMTDAERDLFGIDKLNVPRSDIPAVTHVDYSARIQTVHEETNPRFHALIRRFKYLTGCPVLVNTSFNVRGEPIVNTPEDAFRCFMGSEIDELFVEHCRLEKSRQNISLRLDYKNAFAPD
jgi:carbamoyltransferase